MIYLIIYIINPKSCNQILIILMVSQLKTQYAKYEMRSVMSSFKKKFSLKYILTSVFFLCLARCPPVLCLSEEIRLFISGDIGHIHRAVVVDERAALFCCFSEVVGASPSLIYKEFSQ